MRSSEKSRVMERRGGDPAAGDALGTGRGCCSLSDLKRLCFKFLQSQFQSFFRRRSDEERPEGEEQEERVERDQDEGGDGEEVSEYSTVKT